MQEARVRWLVVLPAVACVAVIAAASYLILRERAEVQREAAEVAALQAPQAAPQPAGASILASAPQVRPAVVHALVPTPVPAPTSEVEPPRHSQVVALLPPLIGSAPPAGSAPAWLARYPAIVAPRTVAPQTEFMVNVSIKLPPNASRQRPPRNAAANGAWTVDVMLDLPGTLQISRGGKRASLTLPANGNSTPARFYLKAPSPAPGAPVSRIEPIVATLWYHGTYLAHIERDVTIAAIRRPNQPR